MKKIKITFEENTKMKNKYQKYPRLDLDRLAFEDEETVEQMQIDYIKAIKKKVLKRWLAPMILIFVAFAVGFSILSLYTANRYIRTSMNNFYSDMQRGQLSLKPRNNSTSDTTSDTTSNVTSNTVSNAVQSGGLVYVTENSKKYHKNGCQYLSSGNVTALSESKAIKEGYSPCKKCFN